jgi:predicted component of type VI protein secretion system
MMISNARSIDSGLRSTRATMLNLDTELREAERVLMSVTAAVGTERQQVARIVGELAGVDREADRARETLAEIEEIQGEVDRWVADARALADKEFATADLSERRRELLDALRKYLLEVRHSEVRPGTEQLLTFDEQYVPYFDNRRLRSLGSASDQSRLTAAYALAAAATSGTGLHPGIVILDEPLQQNPDPEHRNRFLQFLSRQLARNAKFQTIIFTSLSSAEVTRLRKDGVNVQTPSGKKWLQVLPKANAKPVPVVPA